MLHKMEGDRYPVVATITQNFYFEQFTEMRRHAFDTGGVMDRRTYGDYFVCTLYVPARLDKGIVWWLARTGYAAYTSNRPHPYRDCFWRLQANRGITGMDIIPVLATSERRQCRENKRRTPEFVKNYFAR